jgi:hypothetical protein
MIRLERAFDEDADIVGLLLAELRQLHTELFEVQFGDLLVEMFGKHVDVVLLAVSVFPQLDLREHLVGEARAHHEAGIINALA